MEIYVAISDFTPPVVDGSQNILEFRKGDTFEIFDCHKTSADWWGARALKDSTVGYVPSRYMQFEERRVEKLLPSNYMLQKEKSLKRLSDIQSSIVHRVTEDIYNNQMEPEPDYHDDDIVNNQELDSLSALTKLSFTASEDNTVIPPKKLNNPCLESPTRQALHKELLLNYKRGINVLEKPELSKVLQNRRENQRRQEWDDLKKASNKRTSLEMKLEQRANRMKEEEIKSIPEKDEQDKPELQKVYTKITQKTSGKVK